MTHRKEILSQSDVAEMEVVREGYEMMGDKIEVSDVTTFAAALGAGVPLALSFLTLIDVMDLNLLYVLITGGIGATIETTLIRYGIKNFQRKKRAKKILPQGHSLDWDNAHVIDDLSGKDKRTIIPVRNTNGVADKFVSMGKRDTFLLKEPSPINKWDKIMDSVTEHYGLQDPRQMSFTVPFTLTEETHETIEVARLIQRTMTRMHEQEQKMKALQAEIVEAEYRKKWNKIAS
ncbi:MAG: hypothetical protein H9W81_08855 [Enterococcus sp.]|nr:hypothetical protein [Enterococcus sp.]